MLSCHVDPFLAFCADLELEGCEVHLYKGPKAYGCTLASIVIEPNKTPANVTNPIWWSEENVYFLAGVKPGIQARAADADVLKRGMFTLDFDIRKEMQKDKNPVEDSDVDWMQYEILGELEKRPTLGKFRYAVASGNGLHVHYFGPPATVVKEEWVAGMKDIFDEVDLHTRIPCDHGCGNAGRIMRMPGSWNVKDPTNRKPVEIIAWNPDATMPDLECVQERGRHAIAKRKAEIEAEQKKFEVQHPEGGSTVIEMINEIPVETIVPMLLEGMHVVQRKRDGGMRFADAGDVERGFFKHKTFNIIVHEGTSLFDPPNGVGYNPLGLVKAIKGVKTHDAIRWFEDQFPNVGIVAKEERKQWAAKSRKEEIEAFKAKSSRPRPA